MHLPGAQVEDLQAENKALRKSVSAIEEGFVWVGSEEGSGKMCVT